MGPTCFPWKRFRDLLSNSFNYAALSTSSCPESDPDMSVRVCPDSVPFDCARPSRGSRTIGRVEFARFRLPKTLIWAVAVAALSGLAGSGCTNKSGSTRPIAKGSSSSTADRTQSGATSAASQRCQTLLSSGLEMLRPERLGISAEPKAAVDTLNNWVRDCGKSAPSNDPPAPDPATERVMPESARASTKGDLYDRQDIEHDRNCWLFKQARATVARQSDSNAARAVALFDLANRMVALVSKTEPTVPQSLYDIAVVGKGSPEDRAWVFAELLRQTGIDAVILKPGSHAAAAETPNVKAGDVGKSTVGTSGANSSSAGPRWLVGVIIDKQIYLFDPTLGWPIPAPADKGGTPVVQSAATLADVLADDGLLRKLDISPEKPYPLHAADLKSARVEIITSSRYWSPRIRRLESFMSGERSATIYVPLGDVGSR